MSRIADLEQRMDDLERALDVQSVLIGSLLGHLDDPSMSKLNTWVSALLRDQQHQLPLPAISERLMHRLLHALAFQLSPRLESLTEEYTP